MMVAIFAPVQDQIDQVEALIRAQYDADQPELNEALNHLLASGGKRVRPALSLLTGQLFGADTDKLITLSAAIELLHTATLVHDDLIDGSMLRRGNPTINAQWSPAATVLTGDFIFAQAAKLAAETQSVGVMKLFAKTLTVIVNGEIKQLFDGRGAASREDYFDRIYAKTASMFELATEAATILSSADAEYFDATKQLGYELGVAFQIVDDVLDFTGQQTTVGKPVASDLRQGLITLPALYYLEARPADPNLRAVLAGTTYNERIITELVGAIRESGVIETTMAEAHGFVDRAVAILDTFPDSPHRQALIDLAYYIVRRHR
jgi:geranylgeranyl pyrophosphate synthase